MLPGGDVVDGVATLDPVEGGPGLRVRSGDLILEVARRTAHVIIRVHDPRAPQLAAFTGIPAYAPDERWTVTGTFEPFDEPRTVTTGAVVEGLEHHHTAVGTVHFELAGVPQSLIVFDGGARGLRVLFRDATSGVTTYPASRILALGELRRRHGHARLQPREQPAVRPDRVRHLPGPARRERADGRGRGRRAVGALISR